MYMQSMAAHDQNTTLNPSTGTDTGEWYWYKSIAREDVSMVPDGLGGSNEPFPSRCLFLMPRSKEPLEAGCCVFGFRPPGGHTGKVSASKQAINY